MVPLSVQILVGDDEAYIGRTLRSLGALPAGHEVLVGDTGSRDATVAVCKAAGCRVIPTPGGGCDARNRLLREASSDWSLHLGAGETVAETGGGRVFTVVQGGVVSRQLRVDHRGRNRFVNPVFERWDGDPDGAAEGVIYSPPRKVTPAVLESARGWAERQPTAPEPRYHLAAALLGSGDHDGFLREAETYLFQGRGGVVPVAMTRYYCGVVLCVRRDAAGATRNAVACLAANPLMAEFWCLAADVRYHLFGDYRGAEVLYRNAVEFGAARLVDRFPMDVSKYGEYPLAMAASCRKLR